MTDPFTTLGALVGLLIAIILIVYKAHPAYSLLFGALVGGLIGGGNLQETVSAMISGAQGMTSPILRILTSGVLVGALIRTGAAQKIAETIVAKFGAKRALPAVAIATAIICAVGVFIDIAVITAAPVALAVGKKAKLNKQSVLLAMLGGGKAGNIISPNPNTIATAEAFGVDLTSLMLKNVAPALAALVVTILLAYQLARKKKGIQIQNSDVEEPNVKLPTFLEAIVGPCVTIGLLMLRPVCNFTVDPLIALPVGGFACILASGRRRETIGITEFGISKVSGVSILLLGTGAVAGIVSESALKQDFVAALESARMSAFMLAPLSSVLLAGATASTTAGATLASQTFAGTLVDQGVAPLSSAAMINAGATTIDSLPHGSFFHATAGAAYMSFGDRLKIIPFEACVGLSSTIVATLLYLSGF